MTTRDVIREQRNRIFNRARVLGINIDEERSRADHTERSLAKRVIARINDQAPSLQRDRQQVDDPPSGVMDGANTSYQLSDRPFNQNLDVIHGRTAGVGANTTIVLLRSNSNPPPSEAYFWDPNTPLTIVVGNAPAAGDALIAIYPVAR